MGSWIQQLSLFSQPKAKASPPSKTLEKRLPEQKRQSKVGTRSQAREALNRELHALMWEIAQSIHEFRNFNFQRIKVSVGASRSKGKFGVWAYVTPLRYVGGKLFRKGIRYGVPGRYFYELQGCNLEEEGSPLYLITVLVPRFFRLSFRERIETLVHELYHIHPDFRGDLRRFPKPHVHHGPTPRAFHQKVKELTDEALSRDPSLRDHPLLTAGEERFVHLKKRRIPSPTLKFKAGLFLLLLLSFPAMAQVLGRPRPATMSEEAGAANRAALLEKESKEEDPSSHFISDLEYFDSKFSGSANPRYIVKTNERMALRSAPSEWSSYLPIVGPEDRFYAYQVDSTGKWVFLRNRKFQGWYPKKNISVVGEIPKPGGGGSLGFSGQTSRSAQKVTPRTTRDGQKVFLPSQPDYSESDLMSFDQDTDKVIVTRGGPLHETPDPLATRFGIVEAGDELLILNRDPTGEWAYVRLLLTDEEGWYPAEWVKLIQGLSVKGAGKGKVVVDLDGNFGSSGRNWGFGLGGFYGLGGSSSLYARRVELGFFYQANVGENLIVTSDVTSDTFSLSTFYSLYGVMARYTAFGEGGIWGGSVEGGLSYQQVNANLAGLDDDVIGSTGLSSLLENKIGVVIGLRGMLSVTEWMQLNTLLRVNFASSANSFYSGVGISFRFF